MALLIVQILLILIAHTIAGIYSSTLKCNKKTAFLFWSIWIIIQGSLTVYCDCYLKHPFWSFFIGFILAFIGQYAVFFLTTKGKIFQRIFVILTYSLFFCIFMTFFNMLKGSFPKLHPVLVLTIQVVLLFLIELYFLGFVCPLCRAAANNIKKGWGLLNFVNSFFIISVIISSVFPVRLGSFSDPLCATFLFLSVCIMVVYPVIFSNINNMSAAAIKKEVERQNKLLVAQMEVEHKLLIADSQARHDRRHHNLVLLEFANNNDLDSIKTYLNKLVESETEIWSNKRYCDNNYVNTVLTVYDKRAKSNDISLNIVAQIHRDLEISPQDLVIVIANLFENAINGVMKQKEGEKYINIVIREKKKRLLINIENSCDDKLSFDETAYGVGIMSIINTIKKYDGMHDFAAFEGVFTAKISINL